MNNNTLINLFANEEAREFLMNTKSAEELSEALENYGIECSAEEINAAIASMNDSDELSAESLDSVAGGFAVGGLIAVGVLAWLGVGYVRGVADGMGLKNCLK